MPILTKNETPAKGQKAEFELDKAALAAIVSDTYFQDTDNWKSVEMIFKSNPGKQRRVVKFDAAQATPLASFFTSAKARDIFEIEKIIINDFDNGSLVILRDDIPNATTEFDIDITPTPSSLIYSRVFSSAFPGEQFSGASTSIVGNNLVVDPVDGRYAFTVPDLNNPLGAYTIKIYIADNTLSGLGGQLLAGFNTSPLGGPSWSPYIAAAPETFTSSQVLSGNATNGYVTTGYFNLLLSASGYTGTLSISKIEIYEGYNQ